MTGGPHARPPWPRGAVTGLGSLPGEDPVEAAALVFGELPDFAHLPELPARGPGAALIGRGASLLTELPVQIEPSGWRLTSRPGRDLRRARDLLQRDLDACEQAGSDYDGAFKVQVCGPLTLAASVELPSGHRAVSDPGATREIAESLAEGVRNHVAEVAARLPRASVVLQLDEPSGRAVLAAQVPTPSGLDTVRAVPAVTVEQLLALVIAAAPGECAVHCCADDAPLALFRAAGATALAVDVDRLDAAGLDALGEALDAGLSVWLGVAPTGPGAAVLGPEELAGRAAHVWNVLGFAPDRLPDRAVLTPACGLAGFTPGGARRLLGALNGAGRQLAES